MKMPNFKPTPKTLFIATLLAGSLSLTGCVTLPGSQSSQVDTKPQPLQPTYAAKRYSAAGSRTPTYDLRIPAPSETLQDYQQVYEVTPEKTLREQLSAADPNNLWHDFRGEFQLADQYLGLYDDKISFYQERPTHILKVSERAAPYLHFVRTQVQQRNMPMEIALLPAIESGFQATARSNKAAVGLWQFISSTGRHYGLKRTELKEERQDLVKSTHAALNFLQELAQRYQGDYLKALAAYNCGAGNVAKAERKYFKAHPEADEEVPLTYWEIRPYLPKETQNYVPKLLAFSHLVEFAELYDINLYPIVNESVLSVIKVEEALSLNQIGDKLNISESKMRRLNPGFIRHITPKGTNFIVLPKDKKDDFLTMYQNNPRQFHVQWHTHIVQKGDYLGKIAQRYGTTVRVLKRLNNKNSSHLRIGEKLIVSTEADFQYAKTESAPIINHNGRYTVKSGDSLWSIARRHNMSTTQLASLNRLSKQKPLQIGQTLTVSHTPSSQNSTSATAPSQAQQKLKYTVRAGDSLYKIALRHGVSQSQLKKWNRLQGSMIKPGQTLIVYQGEGISKHKYYKIQSGDNLWKIARAHNVSLASLSQYNAIGKRATLQPGQLIKIPFVR